MNAGEPEDLLDWLRFHLAFLGKPEAGEELLREAGGPGEALARLALSPPGAGEELDRCRRQGIAILHRGQPSWPENLRSLPGMPCLLFVRGELLPEDSRALGVVGSRRPSPHGLRQAERFGEGLARQGLTVVSGLARGIDAAAHRGALAAGGRTIAVLGSGLGRIYPREHETLAAEIARSGAVVSEFPFLTPPRQFHFPHRNRILSALSLGVLVVEAGERSGSLITADWAIEQDRPVYALPGRADSPEARGGLRLLQDGARLVLDPEEIGSDLGLLAGPPPSSRGPRIRGGASPGLVPAHLAPLFEEEDAWHLDRIVERLGREPAEVLAELSRLEAEGILARLPGGAYALGGGPGGCGARS